MSHNSPIQLIILCLLKYIIHVSYDSSVGELMRLTVCPLHSPGSIPSHGGEFQGIFPYLFTHTWRGDGHRQVITDPLKGYKEYEAIQLLQPSGSPDDQNGHGS